MYSYNVNKDWKAATCSEVLLEYIFNAMQAGNVNVDALLTQIENNTDGLESLLTSLVDNTGEPITLSSMTVEDEDLIVWERRLVYDPSDQSYSVEYFNEAGVSGTPVGAIVFTQQQELFYLSELWADIDLSKADDNDLGSFFSGRLSVGGKAINPETPDAYTEGAPAMLKHDFNNGALLVQECHYESDLRVDDDIVSNSTTYVTGDEIDLISYSGISLYPNVIVTGATTAYFKIQWSADATSWFDETVNEAGTVGTPAAGEQLITQNSSVWSFDPSTSGVKPLAGVTLTKRARYIRVVQKCAGAISITVQYPYQLLR